MLIAHDDPEEESYPMYSFDKTFGSYSFKQLKKPWFKNCNYRHKSVTLPPRRRLNPAWMRRINGSFFCGNYHRKNTLRSPEDVTAAIKRLK